MPTRMSEPAPVAGSRSDADVDPFGAVSVTAEPISGVDTTLDVVVGDGLAVGTVVIVVRVGRVVVVVGAVLVVVVVVVLDGDTSHE
jgi:hypothetical protein